MTIIQIQIEKNMIKDVLLDNGLNVNIMRNNYEPN